MTRSSFRRSLALAGVVAGAALALLAGAYAATSLNTTVRAGISAAYYGTNPLASQAYNLPDSATQDIVLAQGTAANQADLIYATSLTVSASSSTTLDLTGSGASLTDPFGASLSFLHIKAVYIRAATGNTNNVVVGNAASNPFVGPMAGTTPTSAVLPGGVLMWVAPAAGWAVVDSSSDQLKLANSSSGTSVTFQIVIIGTST